MTFYLIGLGLNENSITGEAWQTLQKCERVYLEGYTVEFPYDTDLLSKGINKEIIKLNREEVEREEFLIEAKNADIALLVYGSPLSATTHYSLISKCINEGIKHKIIYNGSILDAVAETSLQLYKFGKIVSMPKWIKSKYEPESFIEIIKDNQKIKAHTLILVDIGLDYEDALGQLMKSLKNNGMKIDELVICSRLGTADSKIIYSNMEKLLKINNIKEPFCFIIPSKELHFTEEEALESFKV